MTVISSQFNYCSLKVSSQGPGTRSFNKSSAVAEMGNRLATV